MAYTIVEDLCTSCGGCELECPNAAITAKRGIYQIDAKKCTECAGLAGGPKCAAACTVDACVPA